MSTNSNPFQDAVIVSTYTDREAIEDGLLVAISHNDRVSRAVWEYFVENAPHGSKPPNCWPVDLMGWFRAEVVKREDALKLIAEHGKEEGQKKLNQIIADRKALALSKGLVGTHAKQATRVYDENIGGGIYNLFAFETGGFISELSASDRTDGGPSRKLWLMPNENGGVTLMFPEDY